MTRTLPPHLDTALIMRSAPGGIRRTVAEALLDAAMRLCLVEGTRPSTAIAVAMLAMHRQRGTAMVGDWIEPAHVIADWGGAHVGLSALMGTLVTNLTAHAILADKLGGADDVRATKGDHHDETL